MNLFWDYTKLF